MGKNSTIKHITRSLLALLLLLSFLIIFGCTNFAEPEPFQKNISDDDGVWLTGNGPPSPRIGTNGDLYLNTNNGDIYEKVRGDWILVGNIDDDFPGNDYDDG
ncbi:hypothetical protein JW877_09240 [bacterium]|nr:hypothetical protein [bacterium]